MKKYMAIWAALMLVSATGFGAAMLQDTSELGVSGLLDFDTSDGSLMDLGLFYGYYVADYVEVGPTLSFRNDDSRTEWTVGVQSEYDLDLGTEFVPFFGLGLEYADVDDDDVPSSAVAETVDGEELPNNSISQSAIIIAGRVGAKYFITESVALSGQFEFDWASDDIYSDENGTENTNAKIELGLRFFF